jgi:two-component system NtrC family sensor kinase
MPTSLSQIAIRAMSLRLFIVVVIAASGGYLFNYQTIKDKTTSELEKYVQERVEREAIPFLQAEKHLDLLVSEFDKRFAENNKNYEALFNDKFMMLSDGSFRPKTNTSEDNQTQFFLPKNTKLTKRMKKRAVILSSLLHNFGSAWSSSFPNTWSSGPHDMGMAFWPKYPNALRNVPADFSFKQYEYMKIGFPEENPKGLPVWTGPYLDIMINDWLISLNHPYYLKGEYLMSVGLDVDMNLFVDRSVSNFLDGTYNIIFSKEGRLVTHPEYMDKIKASGGRYFIQNSDDKVLKSIFEKALRQSEEVIHDTKNDQYLAKGIIKGPDWIFVLVYPEKNFEALARKTAFFVVILGMMFFLVELFMLYQVLNRFVTKPIQKLINATNQLASGATIAKVDIKSNDEVGMLAASFNSMSEKVVERDKRLMDQAAKLEALVEERNKELDFQRAKAYNASKMATLGEMAGGIAHEINNPLSIISVSAEAMRRSLKSKGINDKDLDTYVDKIEQTVFRISKIVKGMKSFSREAHLDPLKPHKLQEIMENTLSLCQERIKSAQLELICDEIPDIAIYCRDGQIIQTLLNLINNSIDALENLSEKWIRIEFKLIQNHILISVIDSGIGLPNEIKDKIMNPFFTTKEVGKGTGLGLFISWSLIESNGGKLYLDPQNKNTCFVIDLPIHNA